MVHRNDSRLTTNGFVVVRLTRDPVIPVAVRFANFCSSIFTVAAVFSCVITTMCAYNQEYQLINPSTQVALFSVSDEACLPPCQIEWTTYASSLNFTSGDIAWNVFAASNSSDSIHFYGTNTTNFTATRDLFIGNPTISHWKFEVSYRFPLKLSTSALKFVVNSGPSDGVCRVEPKIGNTSTLFMINCTGWYDEHEILDYTFYGNAFDR